MEAFHDPGEQALHGQPSLSPDGWPVLWTGSRSAGTPVTGSSTQAVSRSLQELLVAMADLRGLVLRDVSGAQSRTGIVADMWTKCCEAQASETQQLLRSQQLDLEVMRTREQLNAVLQRERLGRESLEKLLADRSETIADLRDQILSCRYVNRDLSHSTAKLTDAIWDLADNDDADEARQRLPGRHEQEQMRYTYLDRQKECAGGVPSPAEEELQRLKEQYARFCAEYNREIAGRDRTIHLLRSFVEENSLSAPV